MASVEKNNYYERFYRNYLFVVKTNNQYPFTTITSFFRQKDQVDENVTKHDVILKIFNILDSYVKRKIKINH